MKTLGALLSIWLLGCSASSAPLGCNAPSDGPARSQLERMSAIVEAKQQLARSLRNYDTVIWQELALMDTKSATVCATLRVHTGLGYFSTVQYAVIDNLITQSPDVWNEQCEGRRIIESIRS